MSSIIRPYPIDESAIASTNLTESVGVWASGTPYSIGQEVRLASTQRIYVSAQNGNTGHNPATDGGTWWIDKGPVNKLAMFDAVNGTRSTREENIETVVETEGWIDSVALFNLTGTSVTISAIYGDTPRTNELLWSDDYANATWAKAAILPFDGIQSKSDFRTAPDGTLTADYLSPNNTTVARKTIEQTVDVTSGQWTFSCEVRCGIDYVTYVASYGYMYMRVGSGDTAKMAKINFSAAISGVPGAFTGSGTLQGTPLYRIGNWNGNNFQDQSPGPWSDLSGGVTVLTDGWLRIWMTATKADAGEMTVGIGLQDYGQNSVTTEAMPLTVANAQLERASAPTASIRTTSAPVTIGGEEVYRQQHSLLDNSGIASFWDYLYQPLEFKREVVVSDVRRFRNLVFTVNIDGPETVAAGSLIFGQSYPIGDSVYGSRVGITDYSIKETDAFGSYFLTERGFAKRGTFQMFVESRRVDALQNMFAQLRATPVVWVMTDAGRGQIFGIYKSFEFVFAHPEQDEYDLVIEGLT